MSKAKVVVGFPIFNGEKTMEASLRCIAEQDFGDFQAIIFENKSTDRSREIAKAFCASDARFTLFENDEHVGPMENFANAIRVCSQKGEYFCLRACDDLSSSDFLSKLVFALDARPSKLLAVGSVKIIKGTDVHDKTPDQSIFGFKEKARTGELPKGLFFPSEWFYGVYRSAGGADIILQRMFELKSAWCAASYTVAEFVIRDLVVYIEGPALYFNWGSGSGQKYGAKTKREKIKQLWRYAHGCYRLRHDLPPMTWTTKARLFFMFLQDARRKTRYRIFGGQSLGVG
jgi:glycosyltransferase involved in cell wall biosynthesis